MYLVVKVFGKPQFCLLDTGCDVSIIPEKLTEGRKLLKSDRKIYAANQTEVAVLGEIEVDLELDDMKLPMRMLVSDHVTDVMLGIDWLQRYCIVWDFQGNLVKIRERIFPTWDRGEFTWNRRMVGGSDAAVPARSELVVDGKMLYRNLKSQSLDWMTENQELQPGVQLARAVLPHRSNHIPVRVLNLTDQEVKLSQGDVLGDVQPVEVVGTCDEAQDPGEVQMKEMLEKIHGDVPRPIKNQLQQLLAKYSSVFSKSEYDLGQAVGTKHQIDTGNERPYRQTLRRQPEKYLEVIDKQVEDMLQHNIIETAQSAWASNVVMVKKKDGTLRFCIDYRRLNELTQKDAYPLPLIQSCLDAMGKAKWFSTVDLR